MPFTDKDGPLTKAFRKEKHDTASQLLKEYANRNWSHRRLNLFGKNIRTCRKTRECRTCCVRRVQSLYLAAAAADDDDVDDEDVLEVR